MALDLRGAKCLYQEASAPVTEPNPNVLVVSANAGSPSELGPVPQQMKCPYCNLTMQTRIVNRVTKQTHLFAFAFCITGLICLVPLPYCLKSCQRGDHFCSQCNRFLGIANF